MVAGLCGQQTEADVLHTASIGTPTRKRLGRSRGSEALGLDMAMPTSNNTHSLRASSAPYHSLYLSNLKAKEEEEEEEKGREGKKGRKGGGERRLE